PMNTKLKFLLIVFMFTTVAGVRAAQQPTAGSTAIQAGETLFFGKAGCAACHEINGRGGVTGPDLSAAGTQNPEALRMKIVNPNDPGSSLFGRGPLTIVAKLKNGSEIQGVRRNEDTFTLQIVDSSGQLHLLDKANLSEVRYENRSLMPADYASRLNAQELQSLVAYLGSLKGRDITRTAAATVLGGVTYERLRDSDKEPQNWMHYWGNYQATHYSPLQQITTTNVSGLQAQWSIQLPGTSNLETEPLVVDGIMYTSGQPGTVVALDAKTGRQIWRYNRQRKVRNPNEINPFNRGVAILGNRLFVGTLDGALVAIDARTGSLLWETQVADSMLGYSITSAPVVVKDKIIGGVSGGEFGARGFLDAYDAASGKQVWRWYSIPAPGEFGNDTWAGDSWKTGAGPTWLTGS